MPKLEWSFFMPADDHRQLKKIRSLIRTKFTPWGQAMAAAGFFSLIVSSVGTQIAAYFLPCFLLALFITSAVLALFFKPDVEVRRLLYPTLPGETFVYKVTVKNKGKHPIRNLSLFEQCLPYGIYAAADHPQHHCFSPRLAPGETTTLSLVLRTPRRGIFELDPLLACSDFPSGIVRGVRKVGARAEIIVYPRIIPPDQHLSQTSTTRQSGGASSSYRTGDSNEFFGTRDYRHGDRLRDIHWASTAKSTQLVVKEYVEEYFLRTGIWLDTELKRFEKHLAFETRISLCAGLCQTLNDNNNAINIFQGNAACHIRLGRGEGSFPLILEFLASIEGDERVDFTEARGCLAEHVRELSELILLLKDWDSDRAAFVRSLEETGVPVRIIIVRDTPTTLSVENASILVYSTKELLKYV